MRSLIYDEEAQDVAEYGLLVAGVGLLVLVSSTSLGANIHAWFAVLASKIATHTGG